MALYRPLSDAFDDFNTMLRESQIRNAQHEQNMAELALKGRLADAQIQAEEAMLPIKQLQIQKAKAELEPVNLNVSGHINALQDFHPKGGELFFRKDKWNQSIKDDLIKHYGGTSMDKDFNILDESGNPISLPRWRKRELDFQALNLMEAATDPFKQLQDERSLIQESITDLDNTLKEFKETPAGPVAMQHGRPVAVSPKEIANLKQQKAQMNAMLEQADNALQDPETATRLYRDHMNFVSNLAGTYDHPEVNAHLDKILMRDERKLQRQLDILQKGAKWYYKVTPDGVVSTQFTKGEVERGLPKEQGFKEGRLTSTGGVGQTSLWELSYNDWRKVNLDQINEAMKNGDIEKDLYNELGRPPKPGEVQKEYARRKQNINAFTFEQERAAGKRAERDLTANVMVRTAEDLMFALPPETQRMMSQAGFTFMDIAKEAMTRAELDDSLTREQALVQVYDDIRAWERIVNANPSADPNTYFSRIFAPKTRAKDTKQVEQEVDKAVNKSDAAKVDKGAANIPLKLDSQMPDAPDGTRIKHNATGKIWVKQGGTWVPEDAKQTDQPAQKNIPPYKPHRRDLLR